MPFTYLDSNGEVFSSHRGTFYKHSPCSLEIQHDTTSYSTYYSHLEIDDIGNGTFIDEGHYLGNISLDPDNSNCKCDWPKRHFACSTGPHLHYELRHDGSPAHLDGKTISNLRIKTGLLPHDVMCSDPEENCTKAELSGAPGVPCATTYTVLDSHGDTTGQVICPVTKGVNIGRIHCPLMSY